MKIDKYELPDELYYSDDYLWVKVDSESNIATVGIIEPTAKLAKEFVLINLPKITQLLKRNETALSLEAAEWDSDLTSPLTGAVIEVNEELYTSPTLINKDPYGKGWLIKIEMSNPDEINELMGSETASEWVKKNVLQ